MTGTVFIDPNMNGVRNPGETGFTGARVVLVDSNGATVAATTSGADGSYVFDDVLPGTYTVQVFPTGVSPTGPTVIGIVVIADTDITGIDFGVIKPVQVSGVVFFDTDVDTTRTPGEPAEGGVIVTLLDPTGTVVATTVSDPDGGYSFTVVPGDYTIVVDQATIPSGTRVTGSTSVDITVGTTDFGGPDFGVAGASSVGDTVFVDRNGNGRQDTGEEGVAGVRLTLLDANGNEIGTLITGPGGTYLFPNLMPGTYTVIIDLATVPSGYTFDGNNQITVILGAGDIDLAIDFPVKPFTDQFIPRSGTESVDLAKIASGLVFLGVLLAIATRRREEDDEDNRDRLIPS